MHKAAANMTNGWFLPFRFVAKQNLVLNRCCMVGVGLEACLEGENQIWLETNIFLYIQISIEISSSETETLYPHEQDQAKWYIPVRTSTYHYNTV